MTRASRYSWAGLRRRWSDRRRRRRRFGIDLASDVRTLFWHAEPRVILDIGANAGRESERWHREFPAARIHAFEPGPETFARLQNRTANMPNVTAWNLAVGAVHGRLPMRIFAGDETNSLLPMSAAAVEFVGAGGVIEQRQVDVEVTTVDRFCADHGLTAVDLLKSDTQGYELQVLHGASQLIARGAIGALVLETNFVAHYEGQALFPEIYEHLRSRGFRFVGLYQASRNHVYALNWADALFVLPDHIAPRLYPPA